MKALLSFFLLALLSGHAACKDSKTREQLKRAATDCSICLLARESTKTDSLVSRLDFVIHEKCDRLPAAYIGFCQKAVHAFIEILRKNVEEMAGDCSATCESPSQLSTDLICSVMKRAHGGLADHFETFSSSVLPQICAKEADPLTCAKKYGGLLRMLEKPIGRVMVRVAFALDPENACQIDEKKPEEEKEMAVGDVACQVCHSSIALATILLNEEETVNDTERILNLIWKNVCKDDSTPEECEKLAELFIATMREEESNTSICKLVYDCDLPVKAKDEL